MENGTIETATVKTARELLADYAHTTWSGWMEYMFSKSTELKNGAVVIPPVLVERWKRQMKTSYADLPEKEKESDLKEAETIIQIVKSRPWSGI